MNILYVTRDMSFVEPLGVMFLSAIARQDGHTSSLAIIREEDVLARVERERPDMVCLSVMSVDATAFEELARGIKDRWPDIFIVAGGPFLIGDLELARQWAVDAAVQGEGDLVFRDLIRAVSAGEPFDHIQGLNTREVKNPLYRLIEPLDQLPHPDRELVYFPGGHLAGLNVKTFMASRGCAYRCTYCFNSQYNEMYSGKGRPVRRFSVDFMIEEIERVKRDYGATFLRFGDDVFAYQVDAWLEEFAEKYPRRVGLPFYCLIRPNLLKTELVSMLRRAGCHSVMSAIEAGKEHLRREILLRDMSDEVIIDSFERLHAVGIHVFGNGMVGLPNTTIDDDIATVELMAKCKPTLPSLTVLTPFRGTTIGDKCFRENLIEGGYPDHTTDRSILNCFTEKEKSIQVNIVHLVALAVRFPFLKNLILKRLIYLRPNPLFFFAWYLMKNRLGAKYIFPIQAGLWGKIRLAIRALRFELANRPSFRRLLGKRPRGLKGKVVGEQKGAPGRSGPIFKETPAIQ